MRRPFAYSLILHLVIVVAAVLGLPSLRQPPVKEDEPVIVDLVAVSDKANPPPAAQLAPRLESPKPSEAPAPRQQQPAQPQPEPRPESPQAKPEAPAEKAEQPAFAARPEPSPPPAPEPAPRPEKAEPRPAPEATEAPKPERPEPKPEAKPEKADTKPAPPKPEPKAMTRAEPEPEPKAEPRPPAKPKPPVEPKEAKQESKPAPTPERKPETQKPAETQMKPASTAKPDAAKPEAPKTVQSPEPASDFASVSKAVQDLKRQQSGREDGPTRGAPAPPAQSAASEGDSAFTSRVAEALRSTAAASNKPSLPVTSNEIDAVRRQIERCWNLPEGAREAGNLVVSIRVEMNADGTPRSAVIQNAGQMQANPHFQAAADSARRAVLNPRCHPFRLPADKFEHWRIMTLIFNPREIS
jgi:outer membrane biosynthesis protein TonB